MSLHGERLTTCIFILFALNLLLFPSVPSLIRLYILLQFFCAWYFKRIITCCLLRPPMYVCLFCHFFSFPSPRSFSVSHTETDTPPSLSIYSHGISKRAFPTQQGGALLFPDTCQSLICHLCAEMEMSRSDTTCQSWRWRLIALRRLLNQSHSLQLVCWLGFFYSKLSDEYYL